MRFEAFVRLASQQWEEVPNEFKGGVDGLQVERDARAHPRLDEIYTLGECITENYPSSFGGPDTTRSMLVLYYGSFLRLAHQDPAFDWEHEIWETVTHELRHHLESLADEDALEEVDYAVDENFKRQDGERFDPLFYRQGEPLAHGVYKVEDEVFMEFELAPETSWVELELHGQKFRFARPHDIGDICFVTLTGAASSYNLTAVLVPRPRVLDLARRLIQRRALRILEAEAEPEEVRSS